MKKLTLLMLLIIVVIFSSSMVFASTEDDTVYLEIDNNKSKKTVPYPNYNYNKTIDIQPNNNDEDKLEKILFYNEDDRFKTKSFSKSTEKTSGNTSFGTKYSSDIKPENMSNSLTLFSKYKKDKFSLSSAYKQSQTFTDKKGVPGVFSITPEYKLNDYFTLQNVYSSNFSNNQKKNEFILSVSPMKNDRMNLDIGAGQVYYNDNRPSSSQFNFSTRFKF